MFIDYFHRTKFQVFVIFMLGLSCFEDDFLLKVPNFFFYLPSFFFVATIYYWLRLLNMNFFIENASGVDHLYVTSFKCLKSLFIRAIVFQWILTHFMPLISFDSPWKHHKNRGFLMSSGGIKRDQWHEMC